MRKKKRLESREKVAALGKKRDFDLFVVLTK
jgi:hypothetical protein